MIPKEILAQIRRIYIVTSRLVNEIFTGRYKSVFKGQGIEFEEVRPYCFGDDIRYIDWNVTARTGIPYVKKFIEERELTVMLLVDLSYSCHFGTVEKLKRQLSAEICSLLTFSAIQNNDKVGLIIFTDKVEMFIPPNKGLRHGLRIVRETLYFHPEGKKTNISQAVEYLNKVCHRRTVCFILSDFFDQNMEKALSIANKHHDIIAIIINDPKERELPDVGLISLEDPETGETSLIDTSHPQVRERFTCHAKKLRENIEKMFKRINIDIIDLQTNTPYTIALLRFFKMREKRIGR